MDLGMILLTLATAWAVGIVTYSIISKLRERAVPHYKITVIVTGITAKQAKYMLENADMGGVFSRN